VEILIDQNRETPNSKISNEINLSDFRFVLSPRSSPLAVALKSILPHYSESTQGMQVEVCPQAISLAEKIARQLSVHPGMALFIDYGANHSFGDSLRAIKNHKFCDFFTSPGNVDLSAMVDFRALHQRVTSLGKSVNSYPCISQTTFLENIGIDARLVKLLATSHNRKTSEKEREEEAVMLITAFNRLVKEMGEQYQVYCISSQQLDMSEYLSP